MRQQLLRHKITKIDKVFYSHIHSDQTHGINDLRIFYIKNKKQIDVYADLDTSNYLKKSFSYCFNSYSKEYPATLKLNRLKNNHLILNRLNKVNLKTIKVKHGNVKSNCFIINKKLAYISDVNEIYNKDYKYFKNLEYLIIDCLRYNFHPSHFNLESVLNLINLFKPKKSILTNLHTDLDYNVLKNRLPKNVVPAYDGLSINF